MRIPHEIAFDVIDGEAVALNLETGRYFQTQPATRIFQLINERGDLPRVREAMLEEYEVEAAQIDGDLDELISYLEAKGPIAQSAEEHARLRGRVRRLTEPECLRVAEGSEPDWSGDSAL